MIICRENDNKSAVEVFSKLKAILKHLFHEEKVTLRAIV